MTTIGYARDGQTLHAQTEALHACGCARIFARKRIKEQLRAQGVKLSYVSAKEIIVQAKAWLAAHPEIIVEATAKAEALGYGTT